MIKKVKRHKFLKGSRVYLSGPMDFVASRAAEKKYGWRARIKQYLEHYGVTVFDPWEKPEVRGLLEFGREDESTIEHRDSWEFSKGVKGVKARGDLGNYFSDTMHIDLRMVDVSDFVIAFCPTNIYSVGTVHEIVLARSQQKPVLFVSPPVNFPAFEELESEIEKNYPKLKKFLTKVRNEVPIKENPLGTPSLWYMSLIDSQSFFDGFGFSDTKYHRKFKSWKYATDLDSRESSHPPKRKLLEFLDSLAKEHKVPKRWNQHTQKFEDDDDWLLLEEAIR